VSCCSSWVVQLAFQRLQCREAFIPYCKLLAATLLQRLSHEVGQS
jgi:hypothetical protein